MFQQTENKRRHAWPRKGSGMCRGCHVATHYRIATAFLHIDLSTRCQPAVKLITQPGWKHQRGKFIESYCAAPQ
jgi:hypothetical protein